MPSKHILALPPAILKRICSHCTELDALANLAPTCRLLYECALPYLWHTLPYLATLVHLLPQDAWTARRVDLYVLSDFKQHDEYWRAEHGRMVTFTRELIPADLTRFNLHTPFVRKLTEDRKNTKTILMPSAWRIFERVLIPGCLPHLHSIWLTKASKFLPEPLHVFVVAQNLQEFRLYVTGTFFDLVASQDEYSLGDTAVIQAHDDRMGDFLKAIAGSEVGKMRSFFWSVQHPPASHKELLADAVVKMPRLRKYGVPHHPFICSRALTELSSFSELLSLELSLTSEDYPHGISFKLTQAVFPALKSLTITSDSLSLFIQFIALVHSPSLLNIKLSSWFVAPADDIKGLAAVLATHPSRSTVRKLYMNFKILVEMYDDETEDRLLPLSRDHISPLFALRALEDVTIVGDVYVSLDNAGLAEMARAWPSLRRARLVPPPHGYRSDSYLPIAASVGGLTVFAEHCPGLEVLYLVLADIDSDELRRLLAPTRQRPSPNWWQSLSAQDRATAAASERGPGPADHLRPCHPLRRLGVGCSIVKAEDATRVAALLSLHFPLLRDVEHSYRAATDQWSLGVTDLLQPMAKIREQERTWAMTHGAPRFVPESDGIPRNTVS